MADQPDIVVVMTDQQRFDWLGSRSAGFYPTPSIDRLGDGGVVFERATSASPTCEPARVSMLTGLLHHRADIVDNGPLRVGAWTVAHALRSAGYQTALVGRMHFRPDPRAAHGFDVMRMCEIVFGGSGYERDVVDDYRRWVDERGLTDWRMFEPRVDSDRVRRRSVGSTNPFPGPAEHHPTGWIEREATEVLAERDPDRPLFLVVSFPHPHAPYTASEAYAERFDVSDVAMPDVSRACSSGLPGPLARAFEGPLWPCRWVDEVGVERVRHVVTAIRALLAQIDDAVGRLVDALDLERTLVFFTSDHGDYGGHRGLIDKLPPVPFDDLVRVPLVVAGAGVTPGIRSDAAVQTMDIPLTCLDVAGVEVDHDEFDGRSLAPLLRGEPAEASGFGPQRTLFANMSQGYPMIRRGDLKVIAQFPRDVTMFDLSVDPGECRPVTDDPAYADSLEELFALGSAQFSRPPADLPRWG